MTEPLSTDPDVAEQPSEPDQASARPSSPPARSRAVLNAIGTGVMGALLVLFLGIGLAAIVVPAVTGSVALTVRSSSMEPVLPAGTLIVVRPTELADLVPGKVLTYQLRSGEPTLVTHRITQRMLLADGSPVFMTKGDANAQPDLAPVTPVQVRGTVWYAIPYLGWVAALLTGDVRTIVISVVVGGLLLYAAWMFISAARDRFAKRDAAG
ncbi:MAG: signal peptidase I [Micropruina sp.]|uniref:signal peptidase I n=1 Tax=Micropruina sp. TaxID=2737536 RepID=UPI0039E42C12